MRSRFGPGDVRFFDRIARAYDLAMPSTRGDWLTDALALADRPVGRVVDVGGGTGRAVRVLSGPTRIVVDRSAGMLARARAGGLAAVRADAAHLPVGDEAVDAVLVVDALHHLPDREAAVAEAVRALAPGGVLVVREFDPRTLRGGAIALGEHLAGFGSAFTPPEDLARFLERAGLRTSIVEGGFAYTVAGRKRESQEA